MAQREVEILDATLRDGAYTIDFQFTAEDTALICSALESSGIGLIEVAHGLGLGAARAGKGDQAATDEGYLKAAAGVLKTARFGTFFIPGIGEEDDLRLGADCGMHFVRIGTNVTELDLAEPYVKLAKELGLLVWCNLMKSYAVSAEEFARQAVTAESYGADVVCLVDSAGGMLPDEVRRYIEAALAASKARLGFHGHDNLCLGVANAIEAYEAGATVLDSSLQGIGRSEGNTVTEVLVAILQKRGMLMDIDVNSLLDVSEAYIRPLMHEPKRSGIGITSGRARFHSSYLGRVMKASAEFGIDVRELILRMGEQNQVDAPDDLIERLAHQIAGERPRERVRVDIASTSADIPEGFENEVLARARELKEKSSKLGVESVLNVVASPYELTHVSPFVETSYGCALSNIMLADAGLLGRVLELADGLVDYVLLDPGGHPVPEGALSHSTLLTYLDHEMWARATVTHLTALLGGSVQGRRIAVTGTPPLAARAALALADAGAEVALTPDLAGVATPADGVRTCPLEDAAADADAVLSLSPRRPAVGAGVVARMKEGALLYDGGIGSLEREAVPAAEGRGIRVVRVDMRPSLAATALELIGIHRIVQDRMGREMWDGISVVAGGLIGRVGEVIVDSIHRPTRVIGIADGRGGILRADPEDPSVRRVRHAIARKRLENS